MKLGSFSFKPWLIRFSNFEMKHGKTFDNIEQRMKKLGTWLKEKHYKGIDVNTSYLPQVLSTTLSFSCIGWTNLYKVSGKEEHRIEVENCINKLLDIKRNGLWPFPYKFGNFPSNDIYACEHFMTLKSLIYFWSQIEKRKDIREHLIETVELLTEKIGYDRDGCFWYSPERNVRVPNISSMASSCFAALYEITGNVDYLRKSTLFANYCLKNQLNNGGFSYFEGGETVYVPYHALETFELAETNRILKNDQIQTAIKRAIRFLSSQLALYGYASYNRGMKRVECILFKTPLWISKAYLLTGKLEKGLEHFINASSIFNVRRKPYYYYYGFYFNFRGRKLVYMPNIKSTFMRYNASAFETGTNFLKHITS